MRSPVNELDRHGDNRRDELVVRAVTATDRDAFAAMFERMSPQSRMRRYLSPKRSLTSRELRYLTDVDHVRHSAVAAIDASGRFTGVARYAACPDDASAAEVAVEVLDDWQRRGVGTLLTRRVVARARSNGFAHLRATTMWENAPARALLRRLGFRASGTTDSLLDLELALLPE